MGAFDAEKWRAWHRARGERYRYFAPTLCGCVDPRACTLCDRDGRVYTEVEHDDGWRALVHASEHEVVDERSGMLFPKGTLMFSVMPDETYPSRLARIVLPERIRLADETVLRGEGADDDFAHPHVTGIAYVRQGETLYEAGAGEEPGDYEVTATGLTWRTETPPQGRYAVGYQYQPSYLFLDSFQLPRPGSGSGALMPFRGLLVERLPTGD